MLSLKTDDNTCSHVQYEISKKALKKLFFLLEAAAKNARIRIRIYNPVYGSKYPDPYQIVTDPEHNRRV